MKFLVKMKDYEEDILPMAFRGFSGVGYCFLRIKIKNGQVSILCAQLPDYTGTSITNAIERIVEATILHLERKKVLTVRDELGFFDKLLKKKAEIENSRVQTVFREFTARLTLIEHYPEGVGINNNGSFARVVFSPSREPVWNYLSKEKLQHSLNTPEILEINVEELKAWTRNVNQ